MGLNYDALPRKIFSGNWKLGHCQGIAVDTAKGYIYYSFTTVLIKCDLMGNVIGSATGLLGHLGCIDFCERDGRVYGSLEYKNDAIGRGILKSLGSDLELSSAFYIVMFDVDKIDRMDMDACGEGIMTSVYLKEVNDDYTAEVVCDGRTVPHRYGCSGIDGTTIGKMPGSEDDKEYLFVTYGVYGDVERSDNDYQVVLCYDYSEWEKYERPLSQANMHTVGPEKPLKKLFVYTGNTTYGVQNLEYDAASGNYLMAVYRGKKPQFPNHAMYIVDGSKAPVKGVMKGTGEEVEMLSLLSNGTDCETPGWDFEYGSTGICSLGDGYFYVSHNGVCEEGQYSNVYLYRWDGKSPLALVD